MNVTGEAETPEQLWRLFSGVFSLTLRPYFQPQCLLILVQHPANQPSPKDSADVVWEKS